MLISFSVSNFRSFGEEQTLNMVASNKLSDHPNHCVAIPGTVNSAVRTAVIYGANAAGKSNLIKAMAYAQELITGTYRSIPPASPFTFDRKFGDLPSTFDFQFLIDNRVFRYGFDILRGRVAGEWLAVNEGASERLIYERGKNGTLEFGSKLTESLLVDEKADKFLRSAAQISAFNDSQLFLCQLAVLFPQKILGPTLSRVRQWFTDGLAILGPEHRSCDILERLDTDDSFREFCGTFLNRLGTGISHLKIERLHRQPNPYERKLLVELANLRVRDHVEGGCNAESDVVLKPFDSDPITERRLIAEHGEFLMPFGDESDGTKQLLHFLPILFSGSAQPKTLIIDEVDRSLHPLACWELIRLFSESCPGARGQLIVTTHEAHLLDQDLLRRDEYWFVEKDECQQSRLVPLSDFTVRNDLNLQKGYLQGRFGAIPFIGSMENLQELLSCPGNKEACNAAQTTPT